MYSRDLVTRRTVAPQAVGRMAARLLCTCMVAYALSAAWAGAGVERMGTSARAIYRLAVARSGAASDAWLIVGSTYDHRLCAFTARGEHRWDADVGGFVFDLATGDLDGDGRDEIVAAAADGWVYVFAVDGTLRWKRDLGAPVYQAAVARLDGSVPAVLASGVSRELVEFSVQGERLAAAKLNGAGRILRAGDFDGDGADEVAVLPIRGQAHNLCFFKGPQLARLKETISSGVLAWDPATRRPANAGNNPRKNKGEWSGGELKKANGTVADLDGDGAAELIYSPGAYTLAGGLRQAFALPWPLKVASYDYYYNMRLVAAGELASPPGAETVVVEGPAVRLYDARGRELGQATGPQGFTAVVCLPGAPRGCVILGSCPGGDDALYRLTFDPGWEKSLEELPSGGFRAQVGANLERVAQATAAWHGAPLEGADGPYDVVVNHHFFNAADLQRLDEWMGEVRDYDRQFPYGRLRFATALWPNENAPLLRPDGKPWNRDRRLAHDLTRGQIVDAAQRFEAAGCHFWVQVGHGCDPHLEVDTAAAMLAAAPTALLGFISAEDEQVEEIPYYFQHHLRPILDLCLEHHKRFIPRNKDVWWAHWPADPNLRRTIFNGRYRQVLLPCVEDSNSRSAEVNLAARVGLWLDGQVDDWASRCCADWFCASRAWEWEYVMSGHPQLRYYVSQAMFGARVFMLLSGERQRATSQWTRVGAEGAATFLHLLGKGVLTPPRRDQLRAISPVALAMQAPSERFIRHGCNGHHEEWWGEDGTDAQPWAFDRLDTYWAMAPLPPTDVATYLWGRTRRDATHLPVTTPHGFVCLLPGATPEAHGPWSSIWTTDGDKLARDGARCSLEEARRRIVADLAEGAQRQPFRVEGVACHQVVRCAPDFYLVVLVDPGWLDPADRDLTIHAQIAGEWAATDRLTGQDLGVLQKGLPVSVPAGVFRVLELRGRQP